MYSETYVRFILALAPLVVCLAFSLEREWWTPMRARVSILTAILFGLSVFGYGFAVWGCLPWLLWTGYRAFTEGAGFARNPNWQTSELARLAAILYLPVGGVWALFDQLRFQPLGFSEIIVLLTGVHFHYAGFALPRLTGLWLEREKRGRVLQLAGWGVILGVPLVAIGITTSQMAMPFWIETLAVSILASAAFTVSLAQLNWSMRHPMPFGPRCLFAVGGLALAVGMVLATIYGWRSVVSVSWATIPAMYAIHGTLNSLGFCLPGFVAWKWLFSHESSAG
jgi:YndJ-like protein